MKNSNLILLMLLASFCLLSSCSKDDDCKESTFYKDADGDGFGDATSSKNACTQPSGYVADKTDADDTDAAIFPGCTGVAFYRDADGDGFGNAAVTQEACLAPDGYVADNTDIDDTNSALFPGCTQITYYQDFDEDGFGNPDVSQSSCVNLEGYVLDNTDCNDADASIHPGAEETSNDDIDSNCDGEDDKVAVIWTGADLTFTKAANADWTLPENQDQITEKVIFTRQSSGPMYNYQWWQDTFGEDAVHNNSQSSDLVADYHNSENAAIKDFAAIMASGGTKGVRWALLEDTGAENPGPTWDDFQFYGTLGDPTHFYSFNNVATLVSLIDSNTPEEVVSITDDFIVLGSESGNLGDYSPLILVGKKLGVWLVEENIYFTLTFTEWGTGQTGAALSYTRSTPN